MKIKDVILVLVALGLLMNIIDYRWETILKIILGITLVLFVLYWKILPFKVQLSIENQKIFGQFEVVFRRVTDSLSFIPKIQLGRNLQIDSSYVVFIMFLVVILIVL